MCVVLALAAATAPAGAVVIITGNGNTSAPPDDPGFAHVGQRSSGGLTLIYLGNGWVLTANHVGVANLELGSVVYPKVPGSGVRFLNEDGRNADLLAFRIEGSPTLPELPVLEIASVTPSAGTIVTMVGRGYNQDAPTVWIQPGRPPTLRQGWTWGKSGGNIRWGTNRVAKSVRCHSANCLRPATHHFFVDFTKPGGEGITSHEAQAVMGDSGGAVFAKNGEGEWELSGVMFLVHLHPSQPERATLDGNITFSVDLSRYRDQIIPLVRPECSDEIDNDGDGYVDHPKDASCHSSSGLKEADAVP